MYHKTNLVFSREKMLGGITNGVVRADLSYTMGETRWIKLCDGKPVYRDDNDVYYVDHYTVFPEWCNEIGEG